MNGKIAVGGMVICAAVCLAVLERGRAAAQPAGPALKVGVVSMRDVFNNSRKHAQYRGVAMSRQARGNTQVDDLQKELEGAEAELKTFKQGTPDYAQQLQVVFEKRARLQSRQDYLKQQWMLEDKKWLEDLYQAFARAAAAVAKEKGLDLVLERTEPEFPIPNEQLMTTLYMHKVLYDGGCLNLTAEVAARVDADESLKP